MVQGFIAWPMTEDLADIATLARPALKDDPALQTEALWSLFVLLIFESKGDVSRALLAPLEKSEAYKEIGDTPPENIFVYEDEPSLGAPGVGMRAGDVFHAVATPTGIVHQTFLREGPVDSYLTTLHGGTPYGEGAEVTLSCILPIRRGRGWAPKL